MWAFVPWLAAVGKSSQLLWTVAWVATGDGDKAGTGKGERRKIARWEACGVGVRLINQSVGLRPWMKGYITHRAKRMFCCGSYCGTPLL